MHRAVVAISRGSALLGGLLLVGLIGMMCLSILGRNLVGALNSSFAQTHLPDLAAALVGLGLGPVLGDFELIELGMAIVIFAFLPWCQITAGHARVAVFTGFLPMAVQRWLRAGIEVIFALVLILIAWRLSEGLRSRVRTGQTTFILEIPYWWVYGVCLLAAALAALVAVHVAVLRLLEAVQARDILPEHTDELEGPPS